MDLKKQNQLAMLVLGGLSIYILYNLVSSTWQMTGVTNETMDKLIKDQGMGLR